MEQSVGKHILVVDDSADARSLVRDVLEAAGYRVATAASGAAALQLLVNGPAPALVITDLLMPGLTGFALRTEMLRRPNLAGIPVIVLSAYWQRPGETLAAAEVLTKPVNLDRLLATVQRLIQHEEEAEPVQPANPG